MISLDVGERKKSLSICSNEDYFLGKFSYINFYLFISDLLPQFFFSFEIFNMTGDSIDIIFSNLKACFQRIER